MAAAKGGQSARHPSPWRHRPAADQSGPADSSKTDGAISQSHLAHRLTEYTGQIKPASQLAVSMDIFNLYHVTGVHLSDRDGLAEIGVKHGLFADKDGGLAWLAGNACDIEVKKQYQTAQRMGITGVPFFVFQDKYAASGAMGVDEFVEVSRWQSEEVRSGGAGVGEGEGQSAAGPCGSGAERPLRSPRPPKSSGRMSLRVTYHDAHHCRRGGRV